MKATDKLVKHYGGKGKAAAALGVHRQTFYLWDKNGIPVGKAFAVEKDSGGVVKATQIFREASR